jgi:hypothetical protein
MSGRNTCEMRLRPRSASHGTTSMSTSRTSFAGFVGVGGSSFLLELERWLDEAAEQVIA